MVLSIFACGSNPAIFELTSNQSMLITGKGPGQDAAINPYSDSRSVAMVENLGKTAFGVRIQTEQAIVTEFEMKPGSDEEFVLEPGYRLLLDSEAKAKAKVTFRKKN